MECRDDNSLRSLGQGCRNELPCFDFMSSGSGGYPHTSDSVSSSGVGVYGSALESTHTSLTRLPFRSGSVDTTNEDADHFSHGASVSYVEDSPSEGAHLAQGVSEEGSDIIEGQTPQASQSSLDVREHALSRLSLHGDSEQLDDMRRDEHDDLPTEDHKEEESPYSDEPSFTSILQPTEFEVLESIMECTSQEGNGSEAPLGHAMADEQGGLSEEAQDFVDVQHFDASSEQIDSTTAHPCEADLSMETHTGENDVKVESNHEPDSQNSVSLVEPESPREPSTVASHRAQDTSKDVSNDLDEDKSLRGECTKEEEEASVDSRSCYTARSVEAGSLLSDKEQPYTIQRFDFQNSPCAHSIIGTSRGLIETPIRCAVNSTEPQDKAVHDEPVLHKSMSTDEGCEEDYTVEESKIEEHSMDTCIDETVGLLQKSHDGELDIDESMGIEKSKLEKDEKEADAEVVGLLQIYHDCESDINESTWTNEPKLEEHGKETSTDEAFGVIQQHLACDSDVNESMCLEETTIEDGTAEMHMDETADLHCKSRDAESDVNKSMSTDEATPENLNAEACINATSEFLKRSRHFEPDVKRNMPVEQSHEGDLIVETSSEGKSDLHLKAVKDAPQVFDMDSDHQCITDGDNMRIVDSDVTGEKAELAAPDAQEAGTPANVTPGQTCLFIGSSGYDYPTDVAHGELVKVLDINPTATPPVLVRWGNGFIYSVHYENLQAVEERQPELRRSVTAPVARPRSDTAPDPRPHDDASNTLERLLEHEDFNEDNAESSQMPPQIRESRADVNRTISLPATIGRPRQTGSFARLSTLSNLNKNSGQQPIVRQPSASSNLARTLSSMARDVLGSSSIYKHPGTQTCCICYGNFRERDIKVLKECGRQSHGSCTDCLVTHFEMKIHEARVNNVCCPSAGLDDCKSKATEEELELLMKPDVLAKYHRFLAQEADPNLRDCPKCGVKCRPVETRTGGKTEIKAEMTCQTCGEGFCFYHSNAHPPGRDACVAYDKQVVKEQRQTMAQMGTKDCPKCGFLTEKTSGCNHMSCRCGCQWCWLCGGALDGQVGIGWHYNPVNPLGCPQFQDPIAQSDHQRLMLLPVARLLGAPGALIAVIICIVGVVAAFAGALAFGLVLGVMLEGCCLCICVTSFRSEDKEKVPGKLCSLTAFLGFMVMGGIFTCVIFGWSLAWAVISTPLFCLLKLCGASCEHFLIISGSPMSALVAIAECFNLAEDGAAPGDPIPATGDPNVV